jgi:glutamine synthetase
MHHGLTNKTDPGPAVVGDGYGETGERLPTDWGYAVERLARSELLEGYFGRRVLDMFATVKRVEQERFNGVVTPLDYDWVLRSA